MNTFKIEVNIQKGLNNANLGSITGLQNLSVQNHNVDVIVKEPTRTPVFVNHTFFFDVEDAEKVVKILNDMSKEVSGNKTNIMLGSRLINSDNVTVSDLLK